MDIIEYINKMQEMYGDVIKRPGETERPQQALDREMFEKFMERNPMAGGGMLVQPSADGSRPGYAKSKGSGIKLSAAQIKKLKENLSAEDFNKLNFDRTGVQSGQINYGVGQRDNKPLYRKVLNILEPGKVSSGVKIINNKKLSNALIKSTNAGDDIQTIITKMNKLDKSLSRNQISSAINSLVARGQIKKDFARVEGKDLTVGEQQAYNKIIEKEVKEGKLNRAQIAKKAGVSDSVVQDWIVNNKGQNFYDENYTYEKGRLKTGTLQKQKDLFNYIETVDNISAKEIKQLFKMGSGKETQKLMSDLVSQIYRMTGNTKTGSLIVPYDDEGRMREVLRKIRNAPDFEDIYQRRIGDLIRQAYPKGPKRNQAIKSLGEYYKFSRTLKEVAPELALSLDHVVPFQFLEEVKQGKNPINLIKVKPIPQAVNRFKANFDSARIEINRALKINPTDKNTLNKFKLLKELEQITPLEFGGVSTKGNVYDFKAKPIGQSNLIEDAIEGLRTYNRIGKFSKQVLTDEALQKKLIKAGVETGKDFSAFKKITPISKAVEDKVINTIVGYSKLKKCQISLNADGGRIGFANSVECITDGLNEAKKAAEAGDKKAARQLVKTAGIATRGRLLKNVLGPGTLLGEAMIEGAIIGNKVLGGKPADIAYAETYLSYLDPRKYRGELDPLKMAREDMLTREVEDADGNIKTINAPGFSALKSGFEAQDQLSAFNKAIEERNRAKKARRIDLYNPAAADAREQGARADQSENIISSDSFKDASRLAQEYLQGQTGANMAKYRTDDFGKFESGRDRDLRRRRMQEMSELMPRDFFTEKTSDLLNRTQYLRSLGYDVSTRGLMEEREAMKAVPLSVAARMYSPEQVYGTQGKFAGGGIAGLSGGIDKGPQRRSLNPDSQGLRSLIKNGRKL
jgi:transposase